MRMASHLVAKLYGILVFAELKPSVVCVRYWAEPVLAALSSRLLRGNPNLFYDDLVSNLQHLGLSSGRGGELIAMIMALSAADCLTSHSPYHSMELIPWLSKWLGLAETDKQSLATNLPTECSGALVACGQFSGFDLASLDWRKIKMAMVWGVTMVPLVGNQQAINMIIPFKAADGRPGALVVQVKNRQAKRLTRKEKDDLIAYCRKIRGKTEYPVVPLAISLAHGRDSAVPANLPRPVNAGFAKVTIYSLGHSKIARGYPIHFGPDNTWDPADLLKSFLASTDERQSMPQSFYSFMNQTVMNTVPSKQLSDITHSTMGSSFDDSIRKPANERPLKKAIPGDTDALAHLQSIPSKRTAEMNE